jgi:hypothetical protein
VRPTDPPSLWHPLTPLVLAARAAASIGLAMPVAKMLGRIGQSALVPRRAFARYSPRPQDVIVATYPKSGTNWVLQIAQQIAWRGDAEFDHIHSVVPWPDAPSNKVVKLDAELPPSPTGHRVIKTHHGADGTPWQKEVTCIAVVRDPKEVVVSSYHFMLGLLGILDHITVTQWLELFLSGCFPLDSWAGNAAGWWALRDRPNVLLLNFADLKRDLPGQVDRVAAAMGVELTSEERDKVLARSSFQWMKAHEAQFAPMPLPGAGSVTRPSMLRRGEAGATGEMLNGNQQIAIDQHCRQELLDLGSGLPYDDWFDTVG